MQHVHDTRPLAVLHLQPPGAHDRSRDLERPLRVHQRLPVDVQYSGTRLEPAQVGLQTQHHALQQKAGDRAARLGQRGPLRLGQARQQRVALHVDEPHGIAQPRRRSRDQLEVELRRCGLRPARISSHSRTRTCPVPVSRVDLAIGPIDLPDMLRRHEPCLLEAVQRDVDLPGIERPCQRSERQLETRAQLIAVRRLPREEREQHLLHHSELVALRLLLDRRAGDVLHHAPYLTVI